MKSTVQHNQKRVVITGGGTGGHIFPAIAIANALVPHIGREHILFVGAKGKMEMDRVPAAGYRIEGLPIRGLQGKLTLHNLLLPFRILRSIAGAISILKHFRPDVVVGVGGFASMPTLWAAKWLGIPVVIQEQNSIPGKVNRRAGKNAKLICTAFPGLEKHFPNTRVVLTGNPVRRVILSSRQKHEEGCKEFGLNPDRPVLLVVGGSQGARSLNLAMARHIQALTGAGIQVIWQTGSQFASEAKALISDQRLTGVAVMPFIDRMELAYGAATLVVSRAGALAIAEITLAGLPSLLVPFPFAAEDHQTRNAQSISDQGAAILVKDSEIIDKLGHIVPDLITNTESLHRMSSAASEMAFPEADNTIAMMILGIAGFHPAENTHGIPEIEGVKQVYFLGAGGIGMSALARWFMLMGKRVHGYDRTPTPLTRLLEEEGVTMHYEDRPDLIPQETDLVVITPAIPSTLQERQHIIRKGYPMVKRAEVLGMISRTMTTIAVAGTHGKTSTTSLITHLLKSAGIPVTGFVGGITKNYDTNFIFTPESRFMVVEADEFDRSFLQLHPDISIITSTDADHLDIYGTHENLQEAFVRFGNLNGPDKPLLISDHVTIDFGKPVFRYSIEDHTVPNRAEMIMDEGTRAHFDLILGETRLEHVTLGIPGRHNIENSVAASAAALWAGVTSDQLRSGLESYTGVRRRFDIRINRSDMVYIDDYAHHPRELAACINAVRKIYPTKLVTGIFQPHLFTRTRDFAEGFARSLEQLDSIILLEIYPAREEPIPGVTSGMLLDLIHHTDKRILTKEGALRWMEVHKPEVLLTLGAGDIDTMVPAIEMQFGRKGGAAC